MSIQIFISYRRNDSAHATSRLYDRLKYKFGHENVFLDIDRIDIGTDFIVMLEKTLGSCDVLVAIIGKEWLNATDSLGHQRLNNPHDFVRMEIISALNRNILVIPVLVNGAEFPSHSLLPKQLQPLTRRQGTTISHERFETDVDNLINRINKPLPKTNDNSGFISFDKKSIEIAICEIWNTTGIGMKTTGLGNDNDFIEFTFDDFSKSLLILVLDEPILNANLKIQIKTANRNLKYREQGIPYGEVSVILIIPQKIDTIERNSFESQLGFYLQGTDLSDKLEFWVYDKNEYKKFLAG